MPGVQVSPEVSCRKDPQQRQPEEDRKEMWNKENSQHFLELAQEAARGGKIQVQVLPKTWRHVQEGAFKQQAGGSKEQAR